MKRTLVFLGLVVAAQTACMQTAAVRGVRPGDYLVAHSPSSAHITLVKGDPVVVTMPRVISDTIFGWSAGEEVTIPVDNVQEVKVRKLSVVKNALIFGTAVGAGTVVLFSSMSKKTVGHSCTAEDGSVNGGQDAAEGTGNLGACSN